MRHDLTATTPPSSQAAECYAKAYGAGDRRVEESNRRAAAMREKLAAGAGGEGDKEGSVGTVLATAAAAARPAGAPAAPKLPPVGAGDVARRALAAR